jgi:phosphomannomutase
VATGCTVIELGLVTTPAVGVMIGRHAAAGGLVVTASHNPLPWNGIKCLNHEGVAPPPDEAGRIIERFRGKRFRYAEVERLRPARADDTTDQTHLGRVLEHVDADAIRSAALTVVLDSVNGAGCATGRGLLERLGCRVVHLNGEPTGRFAHPPEPVESHLHDLAAETARHGAAVGFAQDPDADRLAIVDETGTYIGEELTLALAARRMLDLRGGGVLAANLSTSRMIDDIAARHPGSRVVRTAVGEANVVAAMKRTGAVLGGEGNGGVIFPEVCWVRDSLSAMALVLSLMAAEGRPLSAIVADGPRYEMIKRKFDLAALGGRGAIEPMLRRVAEHYAGQRLETVDGVRVDRDDGWVHLRPSNTEPIVRLIAEAADEATARGLIDEVAGVAGLSA